MKCTVLCLRSCLSKVWTKVYFSCILLESSPRRGRGTLCSTKLETINQEVKLHWIKRVGFVVGPSGVGKEYGVMSILREYWKARAFVSGDWCRSHQQELSHAGCLVADNLILNASFEEFERLLGSPGEDSFAFYFDAPRSLEQAKEFGQYFLSKGLRSLADIDTLHIHAESKISRDRILHRATLQGRLDDASLKVIRRRHGYYYGKESDRSTDENPVYIGEGGVLHDVVPWLKENTRYHFIDGNNDLESVRDDVRFRVLPNLLQGLAG